MKKGVFKVLFTGAVASLVALPLRAQESELDLTLEDALEIALSENLTVKVADMEVTKTGYARKGTYAALFPQVNFSADYQRTIKKQVMYMEDQSFAVGRDNTWSTGFTATMPLISVELWKSIQVTAVNVELAVEQARSSRQDLIEQVQQSFYATLLANDLYAVYKENYENARMDYEDVKEKYENGTVAKYDLITAEVAMNNAAPAMYDAQNNIVLCEWRLKALMGINLDTEINCTGSLLDFSDTMKELSMNEAITLENNSSLKQLELQQESLHKTYQQQLAAYYPSLNLSLSYLWTAMEDNFKFNQYKWNPYSIGGITLSIPIFSGGQRYNAVKQTRIQQDQLALQRENTARELEVAVRQSLSSMNTCVQQFSAAEKSVEGAQVGYDIAQKRYDVGSGTFLELQDSKLALLQAKLNLNQSIYDYLVAKSTLDKTLGINDKGLVDNNSTNLNK